MIVIIYIANVFISYVPKSEGCHDVIFVSLAALEVVITTSSSVTSDNKVSLITALSLNTDAIFIVKI